jgi:hypothetical protein
LITCYLAFGNGKSSSSLISSFFTGAAAFLAGGPAAFPLAPNAGFSGYFFSTT